MTRRVRIFIACMVAFSMSVSSARELGTLRYQTTAAQIEEVETVGIGAEYHTKQEIADFISANPAEKKQQIEYASEPVLSGMYSAGALTEDTLQNALTIFKQIRYIAGLGSDIILDEGYVEMCQSGALVNAVNGVLTHTPAKPENMDEELYELGYAGCSSSNIAYGYTTLGEALVSGWMGDSDASNIPEVGHRRWALNPQLLKTGFGYVNGFSSMYAHDFSAVSEDTEGVIWPAKEMPLGYFSSQDAWSFGYKMSNELSSSTVTVEVSCITEGKEQTWTFEEGEDSDFYVAAYSRGQMNTVIFRPSGIEEYEDGDTFNVVIKNGGTLIASYPVHFFDATKYTTSSVKTVDTVCEEIHVNCQGYPDLERISNALPEKLDVVTSLGTETEVAVDAWRWDATNSGFYPEVTLPAYLTDTNNVIEEYFIPYDTMYCVDSTGSLSIQADEGEAVTLEIASSMGGPQGFYHKWYKITENGVKKIAETDNASLVLDSVSASDHGKYFSVFIGYWGNSYETRTYESGTWCISPVKEIKINGVATPTPTPSAESDATVTPTSTPSAGTEVTPTPTPSTETEVTPTPTPSAGTEGAPTPTPSTGTEVTPTPTPSTGTDETVTPTPTVKPTIDPEKEYKPVPTASTGVSKVVTPKVSKLKKCKAVVGKKSIKLSWKKMSGISGYQIQFSPKKNFKNAKIKLIKKSKKSYTIKKLKRNKKYYVRIRAYKKYTSSDGKIKYAYGKYTKFSKKTKK